MPNLNQNLIPDTSKNPPRTYRVTKEKLEAVIKKGVFIANRFDESPPRNTALYRLLLNSDFSPKLSNSSPND